MIQWKKLTFTTYFDVCANMVPPSNFFGFLICLLGFFDPLKIILETQMRCQKIRMNLYFI